MGIPNHHRASNLVFIQGRLLCNEVSLQLPDAGLSKRYPNSRSRLQVSNNVEHS